jgi:hypothetical protein
MKAQSRQMWREFLAGFSHISLYSVDPGAYAVAVELASLLDDAGALDAWFVEGWSAGQRAGCIPADEIERAFGPGRTLLLGAQVNYHRAHAVLRRAAEAKTTTIFVFDHWKNYAAHFPEKLLPDTIVVPDLIGKQDLLAAIGNAESRRVKVLPHPGIEAAAERVKAYGAPEAGIVALVLDPTELTDGLGYDWRSILGQALDTARRKGVRLLVKPHPRQDASAVHDAIMELDGEAIAELCTDETERAIARAQEVWGMTTSALNVALAAGRPIRSFQVGRNSLGALASNPHIEPFAIVR